MTTSLGPGPGPSDWLALPKGDAFQHSQNSAHRSMTPLCQNPGPAKDERKTIWIRPRGGNATALASFRAPGEPTVNPFQRAE